MHFCSCFFLSKNWLGTIRFATFVNYVYVKSVLIRGDLVQLQINIKIIYG
jgi:hypothetical protein